MRVIVTGGGTGGHIYPALAIAKGIKSRHPGAELLYVGTNRGLESDIVPKEGYAFKTIKVSGFQRQLTLKNLKVLWQAGQGMWQAVNLVRRFKPDIVIGTGGYVCGPVVMAGVLHRIPTLIHEQNALPGMTNRILSRFVSSVAVTFEDSIKRFPSKARIKLTGLPVRPEIFSCDKDKAYSEFGLDRNKPVVLVFGGSRGARSINMAMVKVVQELQNQRGIQVLHATGRAGYDEYIKTLSSKGISLVNTGNITTVPYLYNMQNALAVASLVVCRAGAATLAELTALGLPSILIPYPYAAENHQEYNARALAERGAAIMIRDAELTGELLLEYINRLLSSPGELAGMARESSLLGRPKALEDILDLIDAAVDKSCNK
ncbi:UDP-N-acetylglucosamine--N-acetylmuramyl-(pentapeptide) pyrophosphoryl-undecaprenol N-acetylglucosamine transferase [Desulfohalotomaculum tongense]|uniref:undecaprenyldiphospho-muramoylpentapeptide beta-N-acetylglucosaminyltransferase n=1 Tax=Desulforadius tongensis TaxID=1216062 RepID=UPI001957AD23|nr:undecaprenyldiphospho-muramoylpentapeptide beta-N-acetylglucosaminyltransferase [Desulforadius tongensis]MBM7855939.1 UDP-N-acetylglucosamine--N-acetylmuramyl-(pentapeptide) pyrophosphoryl-undecaprenol N-acetylglucosamine transferase [Desulforadius tongensis]